MLTTNSKFKIYYISQLIKIKTLCKSNKTKHICGAISSPPAVCLWTIKSKMHGDIKVRQTPTQIPALLLCSCVSLGKSHDLPNSFIYKTRITIFPFLSCKEDKQSYLVSTEQFLNGSQSLLHQHCRQTYKNKFTRQQRKIGRVSSSKEGESEPGRQGWQCSATSTSVSREQFSVVASLCMKKTLLQLGWAGMGQQL